MSVAATFAASFAADAEKHHVPPGDANPDALVARTEAHHMLSSNANHFGNFCSRPVLQASDSALDVISFCERCKHFACLARQDDAADRPDRQDCFRCERQPFVDVLVRFPRQYVLAARALVHEEGKTIDYYFVGEVSGTSNVHGWRDWVRTFAQKQFTSNSVFVDTTTRELTRPATSPCRRRGT